MALQVSLGRGVTRAAYDPATLPTLAELQAKQLADFQSAYGAIDLAKDQKLASWSGLISDYAKKHAQGNYNNYAPFNGCMEKVVVNKDGKLPIKWLSAGQLYALSSDGLKTLGISELDSAVIATID